MGCHSNFKKFSLSFLLPFDKMRIFVNILVIICKIVGVNHFIILEKLYLDAAWLDFKLKIVLILSVVKYPDHMFIFS